MKIDSIELIRNISQFDNVSSCSEGKFSSLNLFYAENGRGKTTLAAILRSLGTGESAPIQERKRLTAVEQPHVVIKCSGGSKAIYQDKNWSQTFSNITVFDDTFVDENIFSGLSVELEHRKNLHELIIGSQGVALNRQLNGFVQNINKHNKKLKEVSKNIPPEKFKELSIEDFCSLTKEKDVDSAISNAEKNYKAAQTKEEISRKGIFNQITLKKFDVSELNRLLTQEMSDLEQTAVLRVKSQFEKIGKDSESWVSTGFKHLEETHTNESDLECPFCAQGLSGSTLIEYYRKYFGEKYSQLKIDVDQMKQKIEELHGGEVRVSLERSVNLLMNLKQFWSQFIDFTDFKIDALKTSQKLRESFSFVIECLKKKYISPLERIELPAEAISAINSYNEYVDQVNAINLILSDINKKIKVIKKPAIEGNLDAMKTNLIRLCATKNRFEPEMITACKVYTDEKSAKKNTENQRDSTKLKLEQYQKDIFPKFNDAINRYLVKFNAGFCLKSILARNTSGGTSCSYKLLIDGKPISIDASQTNDESPSFKSTLSSGDRNALALAFFFATIDLDPNKNDLIVVIDDPMTSLDDHRSLTTVQEIRKLPDRVAQVIALSHNKPFLCEIWKNANKYNPTSTQLIRSKNGSIITKWDVKNDAITEYDRQHEVLRKYTTSSSNTREVAQAIRPVLEGYLRVACTEHLPPGTLLGYFVKKCKEKVEILEEKILTQSRIDELDKIKEYANKFHHNTNPAWDRESISNEELLGFVKRVLKFTQIS